MSEKQVLLSKEDQYVLQVISDLNQPRGDGLKVGLKSRLHPDQIEQLKPLYIEGKKDIFLSCGRKWGKLQRLDEPIITPKGWVKFGDLVVGSEVFDENGNVQKVTHLTPIQLDYPTYRVYFCNGSHMDVGEDHLWYTWTKLDRKNERRGLQYNPSVKTTLEIFETQKHGEEYNHSIPYTKPLKLPTQELEVDPYILGCWLGDGSSNGGGFTTVDLEILEYFKDKGYEITSKKRYCEWYVRKLVTDLRKINVVNNKHIPDKYLLGDMYQRMSLLQGLMDTDGTINKEGNKCTFDNTNKNIAEGVYQLVASLGMKPIWKERIPKFQGKEYKRCYRVHFRPIIPVFRLRRKHKRIKYNDTKRLHHTIVRVEKVNNVPMRCIAVSGDSHLYLAGKSMIPTHNTELICYVLWKHALENPGSACYYVAPEGSHARELIWENQRLQRFLGSDSAKYLNQPKNQTMVLPFKNGSYIRCIGSENYMVANGLTPSIAVYDEFKGFNHRWHIEFAPNRAAKAAPLIIIGTKPRAGNKNMEQYNEVFEYAKTDKHAYVAERTTFDNPINHLPAQKEVIEREIEQLRARGEEDVVQLEYYSKVIPGGKRAVFPMLRKEEHVFPHNQLIREIERDRKKLEWYCITDPGTTTVFGALFAALNRYTGKLYILDEIYETEQKNTSTGLIIPKIQTKCLDLYPKSDINDDWMKATDDAAAWFMNETMSRFGIYFSPAEKWKGTKEDGLSIIKDQLIYNSVVISSRCENLFREMEMYAKDATGKIPKKNDHLIDAYRYLNGLANYDFHTIKEFVKHREPVEEGRFRSPNFNDLVDHDNNWDMNFDEDFDLDI